ncbi:MAG TPA: DUF6496 domain-containing protein, partial [Gemmatimonadaceae bacterium]|nr:DUF6496 domain-containing protein [Gemmatimonadaceae bacterium]
SPLPWQPAMPATAAIASAPIHPGHRMPSFWALDYAPRLSTAAGVSNFNVSDGAVRRRTDNTEEAMATRRSSKGRRRYGKGAQKNVRSAMRRMKSGTLKSGRGRRTTVKSRKQAIAIGLSEARKKGAKVPRKKGGRKKSRR